mgnify:CR=1 FL=1
MRQAQGSQQGGSIPKYCIGRPLLVGRLVRRIRQPPEKKEASA